MRGSSPRVRGSPSQFSGGDDIVGIIPAGAGLTSGSTSMSFWYGDHPRGCGAHAMLLTPYLIWMGSSPRVRGSRCRVSRVICLHGIIPAGAGLTMHHCSWHCRYWDHPRGCGAHFRQRSSGRRCRGSSPRVRGSRVFGNSKVRRVGIIPAGAGLTLLQNGHSVFSRDHPRGCGAHKIRCLIRFQLKGSSPRVRGSHLRFVAS